MLTELTGGCLGFFVVSQLWRSNIHQQLVQRVSNSSWLMSMFLASQKVYGQTLEIDNASVKTL